MESLESRNLLSTGSLNSHLHANSPAVSTSASSPRFHQVSVTTTLQGTIATSPAAADPILQNTSITANGGVTSLGPLTVSASNFTVVGATVASTFVIIEPGTFTIQVPGGTMTSDSYTGTANLTPNHKGFSATLYGDINGGSGIFPHPPGRIKTPTGFFSMSARGNLTTGTFTGKLKFTVKVINP